MLRSQPALFKFCLCALFSTCAAGTACAASAADELADCLYANTSAQDKTTFLQWTYVALGRTEAAKSVQTIPAAKIKTVEKKAQTTLTQLVMKSCPKPAMNLLLSDPKKGLEKALTSLAGKLVQAEVEKRTSPLLSMTITDLLKR